MKSGPGFTLIEVLTTLVILSVGVVVIHQAFGRSIQAIQRSEELLLGSYLAAQPLALSQLEGMRGRGFAALANESGNFEDYPGFSWRALPVDAPLHGLNFKQYRLSLQAASGKPATSVLLLPVSKKDA